MWPLVVVVLVGAAGAAAGESFLSGISRNMRSDIANVIEMATVNYTEPDINTTYISKVEFDMRAMGFLYNHTNMVIDFIASKQAYPEGMVSVSDGHVEVSSARDHWRVLLAHYAGPAAVSVLAVLFAVSLPLAGLFWCCCQWCKSGRRRRAFDRKYDSCLRALLAIMLIALLTLFLFGVVCAFATEAQLEGGVAEAPSTLRAASRDARAFLNATQAHARWLLVDNYRQLELKINGLLTSTGLAVSVQLGQLSRAESVSALRAVVGRLAAARDDLRAVDRLTHQLRAHADQLNSGLRKVKGQLLQTLAQCEEAPCVRLNEKYKIGQLDTEIQYNQMPDVSPLVRNVSRVLESNVSEEVAAGARVFRDLQRAVQRDVDTAVPHVQAALAHTGRQLLGVADRITALAGNASEKLKQYSEVGEEELRSAHAQYGPARRAAGLAVAAVLLAVTASLALGLVCGVCGKRADAYGTADCCHKGNGASWLLCGMGLMFVGGGLAAALALAYCLTGLAAQRFLCDPLLEPRGNRLFADVDKFVNLERELYNENTDPSFTLSSVILSCHANKTIYEVLSLRRAVDVGGLGAEGVSRVRGLVSAPRPAPPAAVTILSPAAARNLRLLADAGLSDFDFDRILQALETNMTSLSLESLAAQLNSTALSVEERSGYSRVGPDLRRAAHALLALQRGPLLALQQDSASLAATAIRLRDGLRFNHTSLKEAISYLLYETTQAEEYLSTQGPELVQNVTREFAEAVTTLMEQYVQRVQTAAESRVGRCGPLSAALNATRDAACRCVLQPTNGYWMSVWWCACVMVALLAAAPRLARLYRHVDPYPAALGDAEYLYDAYADRDNVPLANAYKAEKRVGRGARGGGAGGAGPGAAPPTPAAADAHHARRYNDMAPKHWEEGPPRYHGPTEYERPPPYYYPGPNDRQ